MDHDGEPPYEEVAGRSTYRECGPTADFLAKKKAEQEPKTYIGYRTSLLRFLHFLDEDATVGQSTSAPAAGT